MNKVFDFISIKKISFFLSVTIIIIALIIYIIRGGFNYDIDFSGGSQIQIKLKDETSLLKLKKILGEEINIREVSNSNKQYIIKIKSFHEEKDNFIEFKNISRKIFIKPLKNIYSSFTLEKEKYKNGELFISFKLDEKVNKKTLINIFNNVITSNSINVIDEFKYQIKVNIDKLIVQTKIINPLKNNFNKVEILDNTLYNPIQGEQIKKQAILVSLIVILLILFYIALRFELKFGIAAIIALIHDLFIVLSFLVLFNLEFDVSVIIALLTIMGYSLNDTIVVFDRIRENKNLFSNSNYTFIINKSILQSLNRTLVTSLTTLFVLFCILIWGGVSLKNLSLSLIIGVFVGTYSSIFIASPILVIWENYIKSKSVDRKKIKSIKNEKRVII